MPENRAFPASSVPAGNPLEPAVATAELRVWVENGDRWHYKCSLCARIFGPFASRRNATEFADLHASECSHA